MPEAARETGVPEEHWKALQFIEEVTENTALVQKRVLEEILTQNASAEYLHKHGLLAPNMNAFKKLMPIISYEDIQPDILRIVHGDTSPILSGRPISEFLTSSGTSGGERKLMPTIAEELDRRSHLYSLLMPVMNQSVPGLNKGKGMYLLFIKSESKTPSGLVARPVLTSYYKSRHFRNRPFDPYNVYTSPNETILCPDSYQSMYAQLLCGLIQRSEVLRVGAVFASGFIRAIKFLEKNWPSLCHDIRNGVMDESISDKSVREAVSRILRPDPDLAKLIESECDKASWQGIIKRLWTNTKYIDVIVTGTMAQYIPTLEFYGGGLPLTCTMYASSECYFGLNLNPMCKPSEVTYTLIPTMCYFEFLPVKKGVNNGNVEFDQGDLVDLVDVKLGQEYELVVTTYAGLYRYRVGDVLRVAGFHNKAPNFKFIRRKNVALSIDADKTDESELHNAVTHVVQNLLPFGSSLTEYTSYADATSIPGHYVLFWELQTNTEATPVPPSVFEDCCLAVEECLNSVYRQGRASDKSIGPLEIRIVEDGTFDKLMDYAISQGASINQYKVPRCVRDGPIVKLLNSRVQSKFFSPKCPKWIPGHKKWNKENEGA